MRKSILAALGAAAMLYASPLAAQDFPLENGNFWSVTEVTIDDGHFGDYADYLAGKFRKNQEFSKSKGWIKDFYILSNTSKRADEPDLYLVTIFDHVTTPAEDKVREKEFDTFMATNDRQEDAQSGARAKFRHIGGSMLLQELVWKK